MRTYMYIRGYIRGRYVVGSYSGNSPQNEADTTMIGLCRRSNDYNRAPLAD